MNMRFFEIFVPAVLSRCCRIQGDVVPSATQRKIIVRQSAGPDSASHVKMALEESRAYSAELVNVRRIAEAKA